MRSDAAVSHVLSGLVGVTRYGRKKNQCSERELFARLVSAHVFHRVLQSLHRSSEGRRTQRFGFTRSEQMQIQLILGFRGMCSRSELMDAA